MKSIPQSTNLDQQQKNLADFEQQHKALAEMGRKIPALLVYSLQGELFEKARDWLKENGAPDEVCQAFDVADMLHIYAEQLEAGKLEDRDAESLLDNLLEAANLSIKFGGYFLDGWTTPDSQIPPMTAKA